MASSSRKGYHTGSAMDPSGRFLCQQGMGMKILLLYLAMALSLTCPSSPASTDPIPSYEEYCHGTAEDMAHEGAVASSRNLSANLGFRRAFFTGGSPFFDPNATLFSFRRSIKSAFLLVRGMALGSEQEKSKIVVDASLLLRNRSRLWLTDRPRVFRHARAQRDPFLRPGGVRITLKGMWSPSSGTLCMAGCIMQDFRKQSNASDCKVKAFFRYPLTNTAKQPLVKGIVQSMRDVSDPLFFGRMSITAIYEAPFVFKEDIETAGVGATVHANVPQHVHVWKEETAVCDFPWFKQPLVVTWDEQCSGQDCSPFKAVGPGTSSALSVENVICSGGKVHGFFIFNNGPYMRSQNELSPVYDFMAIEGLWNPSTGQLSASGCYLDGVTNSSLEFDSTDCDIVITLQFPITLELTFRYSVIGRLERKAGSTLPPFKPFLFTGHLDMSYGPIGWKRSPPPLEYAYTAEKIMQATAKCRSSTSGQPIRRKIGRKKLTYPDGQNFADLVFIAILKGPLNLEAQFSPVSINERTNMDFNPSLDVVVSSASSHKEGSLNVSFDITFFNAGLDIKFLRNTSLNRFPAEGVYDPSNGLLCLRACRSLVVSKAQATSKLYDGDKDCEMHITVLLPPTNPGYFDSRRVSGKISSLRDKTDVLFFSPIDITSEPIFYQSQVAEALIQIDFEIVMGMISYTMAIVFIGLQLHHVKKYPKVLSQISLLMLFILILGHLIPLVLNFEALFVRTYPQNVLRWSGGWLEINEVIVRLMTMAVFLMLVRLLYLSWVNKGDSCAQGPWYLEKNLFRLCLITYGSAGLMAMIVYGIKGSNFLDVLKGFLGLIIDFFLFPQVVGNYVWEVRDRILACPFYVGMTFVRTLPHVYDVLRRLEFFWIRDRRYYYANPSWDFYSNVWDVAIPCGGFILAILVFCQQRYGGTFFSAASWRQRKVYSQISMNPI